MERRWERTLSWMQRLGGSCLRVRCLRADWAVLLHSPDLQVYPSGASFSGLVKFFRQSRRSRGTSTPEEVGWSFRRFTWPRRSRLRSIMGSSAVVMFLQARQVTVL